MPTPKPRPDTNIKTAARASCNSFLSAQPTTIRSIRRPSKVVDIYGGGGRVSQATSSGLQGSSRWNPTAEQVKILEEWYNRGLHTPTALQIQYITCQLRFYGRIEGKNVFYWFQNHKARERQKLRRLLDMNLMIPSSLSTNSQETVRRGCNDQRKRTPLPFNLSMQKDFLKLEPPSSCHEIETNRKDVMSSDGKKPVTLELFPTRASSDNLSCSSSFWRSNTTDENPRISNSRENDIDLEFRLSDGDSAHVKSFSSSFINIR